MRKFSWLLLLPVTMGAKGGCGGAISSTDPAPEVAGHWAVAYDDSMQIKVTIGGAIYSQSLPNSGGIFSITHQGQPISFNLDCSRPDVVCPSEVWPTMVSIDQHDPTYPHRMWVTIPTQSCSGQLVQPPASECGANTNNPDCKPVCNGNVTTASAEAFGVIAEDGSNFGLALGGSVVTNGYNCAMLGLSWAQADLVNQGASSTENWVSTSMSNGQIKTAYAGGCIWAGDPNQDGKTAALLVGATVEISNGFTAQKQ
jgi:hypothetical protein